MAIESAGNHHVDPNIQQQQVNEAGEKHGAEGISALVNKPAIHGASLTVGEDSGADAAPVGRTDAKPAITTPAFSGTYQDAVDDAAQNFDRVLSTGASDNTARAFDRAGADGTGRAVVKDILNNASGLLDEIEVGIDPESEEGLTFAALRNMIDGLMQDLNKDQRDLHMSKLLTSRELSVAGSMAKAETMDKAASANREASIADAKGQIASGIITAATLGLGSGLGGLATGTQGMKSGKEREKASRAEADGSRIEAQVEISKSDMSSADTNLQSMKQSKGKVQELLGKIQDELLEAGKSIGRNI